MVQNKKIWINSLVLKILISLDHWNTEVCKTDLDDLNRFAGSFEKGSCFLMLVFQCHIIFKHSCKLRMKYFIWYLILIFYTGSVWKSTIRSSHVLSWQQFETLKCRWLCCNTKHLRVWEMNESLSQMSYSSPKASDLNMIDGACRYWITNSTSGTLSSITANGQVCCFLFAYVNVV